MIGSYENASDHLSVFWEKDYGQAMALGGKLHRQALHGVERGRVRCAVFQDTNIAHYIASSGSAGTNR